MASRAKSLLRRFFWAVVLAALVAPGIGIAQTSTVRRIGVLSVGAAPSDAVMREGIWTTLRELGWTEGRNLQIERRYADNDTSRLVSFADELVRLDVEIIVTASTDAAIAAKNATRTIPIVMANAGDPVLTGLAASLARPGRNITGFSLSVPEVDAKLLSLLHELLPSVQRVGVLVNPVNPIHVLRNKENGKTYRSLGLQPIYIDVGAADQLEAAIRDVAARHAQALVVLSDALFLENAVRIGRTALKYSLPMAVEGPDMLEAGGLISYAVSVPEQRRRVAALIDRILRGAKPADLPIEQSTEFDFGINLKAARALGITVPQSVRSRANKVID